MRIRDARDRAGRVCVGSFDGNLPAFRATNGNVLWSTQGGGKILAPAVGVGNLAFVSTLNGRTVGMRVSDGRIVWGLRGGAYSPGVATKRRYYLP